MSRADPGKRTPASPAQGCILVSDVFDRVFLGDVVTASEIITNGFVAIAGERIAAIGKGEPPPSHAVTDHRGKMIFPGLVDGHMHTSSAIGWPGIEGSTRSAAAGGVTTCVDMPYDVPQAVTDVDVLAEKIGWVERTAHVDVALYLQAVHL
jgi:allantoinase